MPFIFNLLTNTNIFNQSKQNKESALHMAASTGKLDMIRLLHQYKIDLNAQDIVSYCLFNFIQFR